jgi:hypothetical protein
MGLGQRIYREKPKVFRSRIEERWNVWHMKPTKMARKTSK